MKNVVAMKKLLKITDLGEGCFNAKVIFVGRVRSVVKSDASKFGRNRAVDSALRLAGVAVFDVEDYDTVVAAAQVFDRRPAETIPEDYYAL